MSTTPRTALKTLSTLLLGYGLLQMGNTLQGTLLSVRGGLEGFAPTQIGLVSAAFWTGIVLGSLRAGRLIRRVGHTRAFLALATVASSAALLHLLVVHPVVWILTRALTGFCFAGLFMVVESWLNGEATPRNRGQILGLYGMAGLVAGIGGQLLLPAADPAGFRLFCIVAMVISLALVPIALSRAAAPAQAAGEARIDLRRLYGRSPFGAVAAVLCGVTTGAFFGLGPVFAQAQGLGTGAIALFMASGTLGGFAMAWPLGRMSDRVDRRLVAMAAAVTAVAAALGPVALLPGDVPPWVLCACAAAFGASVLPTYSIVTAHVNDTAAPGEFVSTSGGLLILQGAGSAAGPVVAGVAMSAFGPAGLAYTAALAQALIVLWGACRVARRPAPRPADKGAFVIEPTVPVGTALSPARGDARTRGAALRGLPARALRRIGEQASEANAWWMSPRRP